LENFANICKISKDWSMEKFLNAELEELKAQI
jgi:hypothetical protein